jgi:hypothetical protein
MRRYFGLASILAAAIWHLRWEAIRAWLFDQGFHFMNPYLFGITADQIFHWGPALAFVSLGVGLFYKTSPGRQSRESVFEFSKLTEVKEPPQTPLVTEDIMTAADIEPHQILEASPPVEKTKPRKYKNKTITDVDPDFLFGLFKDRTVMQGAVFAKQYTGKWIICSGTVHHVDVLSSGDPSKPRFIVAFQASDSLQFVTMVFSSKWKDRLLLLSKGQAISVLGKIARLDQSFLSLEDCEIVE